MASMSDIRDKFGFVNPDRVEEYLGNHPQLVEPLLAFLPIAQKHMPEAGTPQLKHQDLGCLDGDLMIYLPLPEHVGSDLARHRLSLIDHEWWMPLPHNVRSLLLADVRWNQETETNEG
jgi:hypothetical protein